MVVSDDLTVIWDTLRKFWKQEKRLITWWLVTFWKLFTPLEVEERKREIEKERLSVQPFYHFGQAFSFRDRTFFLGHHLIHCKCLRVENVNISVCRRIYCTPLEIESLPFHITSRIYVFLGWNIKDHPTVISKESSKVWSKEHDDSAAKKISMIIQLFTAT